MKREDLKKLELSDEIIDKILDLHHEDLDPARDKADKYESEKERADKLKADFDEQSKSIEKLQKANGTAEELQKQIETLNEQSKTKDEEHQKELAEIQSKLEDTEFDKALDGIIGKAGAKRLASVRAELDLASLKESKNREKDMEEAVKALQESEDTSFLFGKSEPNPTGERVDVGGGAGGDSGDDAQITTARAVMGLPEEK